MPSAPAPLRPGPNPALPRYYLGERALSGGDVLQLCISGGWVTGRYEYDPGIQPHPRFHFSIELDGGSQSQQAIELPEGALVRWP